MSQGRTPVVASCSSPPCLFSVRSRQYCVKLLFDLSPLLLLQESSVHCHSLFRRPVLPFLGFMYFNSCQPPFVARRQPQHLSPHTLRGVFSSINSSLLSGYQHTHFSLLLKQAPCCSSIQGMQNCSKGSINDSAQKHNNGSNKISANSRR